MNNFFLIVVTFCSIPVSGFCVPNIPEKGWQLSTMNGFWEDPQYVSGHTSLRVNHPHHAWEKYPWDACGDSYGYHISVSQARFNPIMFRITDDTGQHEHINAKEEYPHPMDKYKTLYFIYYDLGILIVSIHKTDAGIHHICCCWQTLEMLEASFSQNLLQL